MFTHSKRGEGLVAYVRTPGDQTDRKTGDWTKRLFCCSDPPGTYTHSCLDPDHGGTVNRALGKTCRTRSLAIIASCLIALFAVVIAGCGSSDTKTEQDTSKIAAATSAGTGQFATLPTRKCRTEEGLEQPAVPLDSKTTLPVSAAGLDGLAAFANSIGTVLIGPADWKCSSTVYVDGGVRIGLSPSGSDPFDEGANTGITYNEVSSCQGCIAAEICAILPNAPVVLQYAGYGTGCDRKKPLQETLTPIGDLSVMFNDPPGITGQGYPSGGELPSLGMLTYSTDRGVQQVTCTVPQDLRLSCPSIVSGSMLQNLASVKAATLRTSGD